MFKCRKGCTYALFVPYRDDCLDLHLHLYLSFSFVHPTLATIFGRNLNSAWLTACGVKMFADFSKINGRIRPASQLRHTNALTRTDISQLMGRNLLTMPHQRSSAQQEQICLEDDYMARLHIASKYFLANLSSVYLGSTYQADYSCIGPMKQQLCV